MGSKNCMNEVCRATTSSDWKKGWSLKSGGLAWLCYNCGSAYENSIFCETFHSEDSGWRPCRVCGKMVHCGCIASRHLHEYMDFGGVACISCAKRLEIHAMETMIPSDILNGKFDSLIIKAMDGELDDDKFSTERPSDILNGKFDSLIIKAMDGELDDDKYSTERPLQLTKSIGVNNIASAFEQIKRDEPSVVKTPEIGRNLASASSSVFVKPDNMGPRHGLNKDMPESLTQPCLSFSLSANPPLAGSSSLSPHFAGGIVEGSDQNKGSLQKTRHVLAKPPKPSPMAGSETSRAGGSQVRVPRPPAEGRGRSQLLPRYWPRITDQELQQLSGDLNSTIVPLFEKILSASDAGRIGRLVLPKACAEAYFPTINQSEGIPIKIQDIKGKEWTFQFRFWPNNNSRMYVLEGVTPCIQSMQVQAGDTVIFSRRDPGGQLVIGCRKTVTNTDVQEPQTPAIPNSEPPGDTSSSGGNDNLPANGGRGSEDTRQMQLSSVSEKKKPRNIKNKRLHMYNDDALELRITWEEAQELLRPPPSSEPTVFMVEDYEFEEFEEPPVFGKRTIFISQPSGELAQLVQCDSCSKWRKLPVHALISANWTCAENIWDTNRSSCSAPEEMNQRDPNFFSRTNKDHKKQKTSDSKSGSREGEPSSGLDALANAAVLGDNITELTTGPTTRHPRHRPGCSCIVCIQPPSGKGRHDPTCKCNVCLTVKRRFKTLMLRKKKKQSDREAELAVDNNNNNSNNNNNNNEGKKQVENNIMEDVSKARLDLNSDPHREDEILAGTSGMSLTTLINTAAAAYPLDMYLGQNGLQRLGPGLSLISRASSGGFGGVGSSSGNGKQQNNSRVDG